MATNGMPAPPTPSEVVRILEQAAVTLDSWKAHVRAYATSANPELGSLMNASRIAKDAQAMVNDAVCTTRALVNHAADHTEIASLRA